MERCTRTGLLLLNGQCLFTGWDISSHWPEDLCTYETCELISKYIEDHEDEMLTLTVDYESDYKAAQRMIQEACEVLEAKGVIIDFFQETQKRHHDQLDVPKYA